MLKVLCLSCFVLLAACHSNAEKSKSVVSASEESQQERKIIDLTHEFWKKPCIGLRPKNLKWMW